jgi:thiamine-phosphate pyrophosphorylase
MIDSIALRRPLYALYPGPVDGPAGVEEVIRALCEGGAGIIQYREQQLSDGEMVSVGRRIVQVALEYRVPVVINDRPDIARLAGAGGVHLGQHDLPVAAARVLLGGSGLVGVSVDTAGEAQQAEREGVDYVSLGPAYPTTSKQDVPAPRPLALYGELADRLKVPLVAIGGIDADNVAPLAGAGVTAVAVLSALYRTGDISARARAVEQAFLRAAPSGEKQGKASQ